MISFEDLILIFYIWVPDTTIEGTMKKKSNLNNTFVTTIMHLTINFMVLVDRSFFFSFFYFLFFILYLIVLAPNVHL